MTLRILIAAFALAACEAREAVPPAATTLSESTPVAVDGIGPLKIGMTLSEAERVLGKALNVSPAAPGSQCRYATLSMGPPGLAVMLIDGVIARIEIRRGEALHTAAGIHIGSSEAEIDSAYGARVTVAEQKYEDGHDFTVTDPTHPDARYVFETDGTRVTRYRAGRLPEVEFVEGCS